MVAGAPVRDAFDDYRLLRPLGEGGMGSVWLGHDTLLDRQVALKFLSGATDGTQGRTRLLSEARALARIQHPNVAAVYRVGEVDGQPYIAYEYVDGVSLAAAQRPMPWARALEIAAGLARGLAAAHRHGVLHRDIKPANVVLTRRDEPKLIDFGIARVRRSGDEAADGAGAGSPELAVTDVGLAGTPLYMAPELWEGRGASEATDLYALGLVLYELLGGSIAPAGQVGAELIARLAVRELPHLSTVDPSIPASLADLVARLTAASPADRYRRAEAVVDGLDVIRSLYRSFVERSDPAADDQALLIAHFDSLGDRRRELGRHFYDHLFASHPELRRLFPADMAGQQQKLEDALDLVVHRLAGRDTLVPILEDLGRRHADYGVLPEHFEAAGTQLLATLQALSGPAWGEPLRRAWAHAYDRVAHVIVRGLVKAQAHVEETQHLVPPTQWNLPVGPPAVSYARSGPVSLAYQVIGAAPLDLVFVPGAVSHLEVTWEHRGYAALLRRLSSFARVIVVDKRGSGLSDRALDALALDEQIADLDAVLDAVGCDRAAILATSAGGALGAAYAAMRPERARALILYGAAARARVAPDYPHGASPAAIAGLRDQLRDAWGGPLFLDAVAPSLASDGAFREWWARYLRASASPGAAEAILAALVDTDLRALLGEIRAPTLVLHRRRDRVAPIGGARAAAAAIPGARLVELDGDDHLPFVGDVDTLLAEVHRFLAGMPEGAPLAGRLGTTVALVVHDPAAEPTLRALFSRAFAGLGVIDGGAMAVEAPRIVPAIAAARSVLGTAGVLGLSAAAAVVTAPPDLDGRARAAIARARAALAPAGTIALNHLARELARGSRAALGDDDAGVVVT